MRGRTVSRRRLLAYLSIALLCSIAFAQPPLSTEFLQNDRLRQEGDSVYFCILDGLFTADFNRAAAQEIASAMLLEPVLVDVHSPVGLQPYDYRMPLDEAQFYYTLANQCDAFMGYPFTTNLAWEWMVVTQPYHQSRMLYITLDPALNSLAQLPPQGIIATRSLVAADLALAAHIQAQPAAQRWYRHPFFNNEIAVLRLVNEQADVALVWEPALRAIEQAIGQTFRVIDPRPMDPTPIRLGIALRQRDRFLQAAFDQAIASLAAEGVLDELAERYGMGGMPFAPGAR